VALPLIALLAWNNFVGEFQPRLNFIVPTLVAVAAFAFGALRLLLRLPTDARAAARGVALVCLFAAVLWSVRLLFLLDMIPLNDPASAKLANATLAISQLLISVAGTFALLAVEVRSMEQQLRRQASSDALTGLPNRWAVAELFHQEVARAARQNRPFGLLLMDIDHFKRINDLHGHLAGDAMLRHIASTLAASKRSEDVLARVGGEEFLLLCLGTDAATAHQLAMQMHAAVQAADLDFHGQRLNVTLSGGLALYPDDGSSWEMLYAIADQRLYQAKHAGRNQICGPNNPN
jgi:diguanylate cyclase (GGDEF)-like protein